MAVEMLAEHCPWCDALSSQEAAVAKRGEQLRCSFCGGGFRVIGGDTFNPQVVKHGYRPSKLRIACAQVQIANLELTRTLTEFCRVAEEE